jgi:hypothetical protein
MKITFTIYHALSGNCSAHKGKGVWPSKIYDERVVAIYTKHSGFGIMASQKLPGPETRTPRQRRASFQFHHEWQKENAVVPEKAFRGGNQFADCAR